ncbi:hypothetical protein [Enterobacter kobei]|uniref:hypothetical protein n=1 Tax=Enterobacter kobei TaxID=208224 RepID=UPI003D656AC1
MSNITREQAKDLRNAFQCWQQDYDPVEDKEQYDMFGLGVVAMDALLASLEAEAVGEVVLGEYDDCGCHPDARVACIAADGQADWENFKDGTRLYTAPPAPVSVPDEDLLHMAASAIDDLLSNKDRSGAGVWADIPAKLRRAAMLQGADDEIGSWQNDKNTPASRTCDEHIRYESNAGGNLWIQCSKQKYERMKAAGMLTRVLYERPQNAQQNIPENIPATQFKSVADLYGLTSPTGGETSFTFDAVEARDFINGGWSCQEYVELERYQEAMLQGAESVTTAYKLPSREHFISLCNQFWNWREADEINAGEEEPRLEWNGSEFTHRVTQALWRMYQASPGNSQVIPDDVRRMDWLVSKTVDVREPMVYGSHSLFWSQTITDEEDDYHATKLREQIDAAMAAENAAEPQQEVES